MKDDLYVGMRIEHPMIEGMGVKIKPELPDGCVGIMFVFKSKKAVQKFYGKNVPMELFKYTPLTK